MFDLSPFAYPCVSNGGDSLRLHAGTTIEENFVAKKCGDDVLLKLHK
jgi:hypothetical protein